MPSKKCQKYMNQYQERNYAPTTRKIEKSNLSQYCNRGSGGKEARETSGGDCLLESGEVKEKVKADWIQTEFDGLEPLPKKKKFSSDKKMK